MVLIILSNTETLNVENAISIVKENIDMGPLILVLDLRERYTGDAEAKMVTMTCQVGAGALSQQPILAFVQMGDG